MPGQEVKSAGEGGEKRPAVHLLWGGGEEAGASNELVEEEGLGLREGFLFLLCYVCLAMLRFSHGR